MIEIGENMSADEVERVRDDILHEIFADAYAGMNKFGAHAEQFGEQVQQTVRERGAETRSRENDAATQRKTAPPDGAERMSEDEGFLNRYSQEDEAFNPNGATLKEQLKDAFETSESFEQRYVLVGRFSGAFREIVSKYIDIHDLPIVMNYRDAYLSMEHEETGKYHGDGINYHGLGVDGLHDALLAMNKPEAIMIGKRDGKIEIALSVKDEKGRTCLAIVELNTRTLNSNRMVEAHVVASVYGRRNMAAYIEKARSENRLLYEEKEAKPQGTAQVQYEGSINGLASETRVADDNENVKSRFSVDEDSDGRALSEQQAEYFKDSKARDEDGRLLTFYHGTKKGGFTVFRDWAYLTPLKQYAERYTDWETGETMYEVYANITKPFDTRLPECRRIFEEEFYWEYGGTPVDMGQTRSCLSLNFYK